MPDMSIGSSGPATDASGHPVLDPTKNVLDLVNAAIRRQDELRAAESRHVREVIDIRAGLMSELRQAETARIDAIRAVDIGAVNRAAEVSAQQAQTLAAQVATSAETLRTQEQAAAPAATVALAAALEPIQKDIADLRRAQYEAQGQKTQVVESQSMSSTAIAIASAVISVLSIITVIILTVFVK